MTAPIFGVLFRFFFFFYVALYFCFVLFPFYVYLLSDAVWLYGERVESRSAIQVGQYAAWSYSTTKRKKKRTFAAFASVFRAVPIRWRVVITHPSLHLPCICIYTYTFFYYYSFIFFLLTNPVSLLFWSRVQNTFFSPSSSSSSCLSNFSLLFALYSSYLNVSFWCLVVFLALEFS